MDQGLLIARLVLGTLMAAHGAQKLFGWFGGHGLDGTSGFFAKLGFRPAKLFAAAAGAGEITGGLLIALGLFGPIGPAIVLSIMLVAAVTVHWNQGLFALELPLLYAASAVALALTGPGRLSLDSLLGIGFVWTPLAIAGVLAAGFIGGVINLSLRHAPVTAE